MTTTHQAGATTPLADSLELLERAIGYTRVTLQEITPAMLCRPTPCADWTLLQLLDHMDDSLTALHEAADVGAVDLAGRRCAPTGVEVIDRLRDRACALLGAWSATARDAEVLVGDRAMASSLLACTGALEIAAHGWDVSQTTGSRQPIPAALARELLVWVDVLVTEADRPTRFDHPVPGPSIGPSSRLLRLLGREP